MTAAQVPRQCMHTATAAAAVAPCYADTADMSRPRDDPRQSLNSTARTNLDVFYRKRYLRWAAVQVDAHAPAVALPPGADAEQAPEAIAHAHGCSRGGCAHAHPESTGLAAPQRQRRH